MVCRAGGQYLGDDQPAKTKNWSGDVPFTPVTWKGPKHAPAPNRNVNEHALHPLAGPPVLTDPTDGLASLVEAVAEATENGQAVHAIGSGWAFEDCAKSDGMMISLTNLNWQLFDVVDSNNGALTDDSKFEGIVDLGGRIRNRALGRTEIEEASVQCLR